MARTRSTVARHAHLRSPKPWAQALALAGVAALVVAASAVGVVGYFVWDLSTTVADGAVELEDAPAQPPAIGAYEGAFDLMIVGTDECEAEISGMFGDRCSGPDAEGQLNDVNLLVHVSDAPRRITAISFPRDLMLPIPSCTSPDGATTSAMSKQPINSAYGTGGLSCVVDTVSDLSEQPIPYAAKVSFGNVMNITDAVGGVEVCIGNGGIRDSYTGIDWPAGPRVVQGYDALQFLRTRHGVGDSSDLARIGNQQQYMSRLVRKILSDEVLSNPATVANLAGTAARNITPSTSLADPVRIAQLAMTLRGVSLEDITFVQYPVLTDPDDPAKVVPDRAAAQVLWDALAANQPLELTGTLGANGGVIDAGPVEPPAPESSPAPSEEAAAPEASAVPLPENVSGSNAAQETCSAGNVRG